MKEELDPGKFLVVAAWKGLHQMSEHQQNVSSAGLAPSVGRTGCRLLEESRMDQAPFVLGLSQHSQCSCWHQGKVSQAGGLTDLSRCQDCHEKHSCFPQCTSHRHPCKEDLCLSKVPLMKSPTCYTFPSSSPFPMQATSFCKAWVPSRVA